MDVKADLSLAGHTSLIVDFDVRCRKLIFSSTEHEELKVSYCDRSMSVVPRASSVVRCQQFALKAYSSYTPGPIDSKLGRKHRRDL